MSTSQIAYTDKERTARNHTVAEAIATYKRLRHSNSHPIICNDQQLMMRLPKDTPITVVQMNGLVEQAQNFRLPTPQGFDLEKLVAVSVSQ